MIIVRSPQDYWGGLVEWASSVGASDPGGMVSRVIRGGMRGIAGIGRAGE